MPVKIFFCYAHEDELLLNKLKSHLSPLQREGLIDVWHDRDISAGAEWEKEIDINLNTAQIILLLISPDFLASDYCYHVEMQRALEQHTIGNAYVIPIILRPVDWNKAPFAQLQPLPTDGKPVTSWTNPDDAFANVARGIRHIVEASLKAPTINAVLKTSSQPIWMVPYRRNPFFTGREELLTHLHKLITQHQAVALTQAYAISGLGGIGKTQAAVEYAYRYRNEYNAVLWARADTHETLVSDFMTIAHKLDLPGIDGQDQYTTVVTVKRWLQDQPKYLLILDNADDLAMVSDFLPSANTGHILLTTRAHSMGGIAQKIEVEQMGPKEGALFLLRRATLIAQDASLDDVNLADCAMAEEISRLMDGLPLALDQAGAYIEETACGLAVYLNIYRSQRAMLLQERGGLAFDHPEPVATTWSLALDKIEQINPAAADLMRFCAFLDPVSILEEMINSSASDLGLLLQPIIAHPHQFNAAIKELLKFSLIRRDPRKNMLIVHRLVQAVIKDGMNEERQREWAERAVRVISHAFPDPRNVVTWTRCRQYLPQAKVAVALIEQWNMKFVEASDLLKRMQYYEQEVIQHALKDLPSTLRAPVLLAYWYDLSHDEIATALHISPSTVKLRLTRARRQLREILPKYYKDMDEVLEEK